MIFKMFLKDFMYLFLERGEGRERKRERNIDARIARFSRAPSWGPGPHPRRMPWLGIQPATLQFAGQRSIRWTTPARTLSDFDIIHTKIFFKSYK